MKRPFAASVWKEGDWYVSQCLEIDVASQGETEEEALSNLKDALELYFEPPRATRPPQVRLIEGLGDQVINHLSDWVTAGPGLAAARARFCCLRQHRSRRIGP